MGFASVKFDVNLISCIQMEDNTVGSVVIILVSVLGDGASTNLREQRGTNMEISRFLVENITLFHFNLVNLVYFERTSISVYGKDLGIFSDAKCGEVELWEL